VGALEESIDNYYRKVNARDKVMGLWALNYVKSEKNDQDGHY